ncbi:MAG: methyltransferase domain-containing protein [Parasphingorhabdus sp.]|uniref:class I SAM-dependent methyltransferase n=1 Tax=Parasphingorhabdus sp. TaxID=2709688 RepID=UPI003296C027
MDRGNIGVLPRPTKLADESYLEFVTSFRKFAIQKGFPVMAANGEAALGKSIEKGETPTPEEGEQLPLSDIKKVFAQVPFTPTWQRFVRSQQEMMWRGTRKSFVRGADKLMQDMADAEISHPDNIHYDSNFEPPKYTRCEIHCQPGGYTDDPLGGIVFHYGTKIFYEGFNDQDELHIELAEKATKPEDGKIEQILDVGCSIGQCTTHLKTLYPQAEIWGLDVGLPLIRYGHMRAVQHGKDVHFKQALAEDSGFADGQFDMILAYILFHEVPVAKMKEILAEMFRVLRPGGKFSIFEFPNNDDGQVPPGYRFMIDNDSRDNCEPYSPAFVASDFKGILEQTGFIVEDGPKSSNEFLQSLIATKPA